LRLIVGGSLGYVSEGISGGTQLKHIAAAAIAIAAFSWPPLSIAADATQEKCTCDLKDPTLSNGASVRNATACWSSTWEDREWCDISVQAIEGDTRHQTIISTLVSLQRDPAGMTKFLQERAEALLESNGDRSVQERAAVGGANLTAVIESFDKLTTACVEGFLLHRERKEPFNAIQEGGFGCHVGETTGWLRMSFQVGEVRFVFMVAPDA
jgi:hypothetical protein